MPSCEKYCCYRKDWKYYKKERKKGTFLPHFHLPPMQKRKEKFKLNLSVFDCFLKENFGVETSGQ